MSMETNKVEGNQKNFPEESIHKDNALLIIGDFIAVWLALIVSQIILSFVEEGSWTENWATLWDWNEKPRLYIFFSLGVTGILWFWTHLSHYTYSRPFWTEFHDIWRTVSALAVIDLAIKAVLQIKMYHLWWVLTWGGLLILIPIVRYIIRRILIGQGYLKKPTYIIGNSVDAEAASKALCSEINMGCEMVGIIPMRSERRSEIQGKCLSLVQFRSGEVEKLKNAKIVFALGPGQESELDTWIRELVRIGAVDISVIPPTRGVPLYGTTTMHFFSQEILLLRIRNNLARKFSRFYKRVFDIAAAICITLMISPILFFIYYKVARTGTSAIFGHERIGQGGKPFKCYKFRTMVPDAAERLAALLRDSPEARKEWELEFKLKNDPRITPIGHFLRKTSLDELPQLWNVIKGEMSLVGPRPVVSKEIERYGANAIYYYLTKPGMTGLWQVSGRNDIDYSTRVYLDVWYLKNWSLWHDLAILFKTFKVLTNRGGAY